ncbi:MAG: hypothetical protein M3Z83_06900, partial [Actinomycetota bacterium]|nr:hypothetical protein [Actinomycetota bacterium]
MAESRSLTQTEPSGITIALQGTARPVATSTGPVSAARVDAGGRVAELVLGYDMDELLFAGPGPDAVPD